jgi:glycosyltransferase involved in cell wall biosynthesis
LSRTTRIAHVATIDATVRFLLLPQLCKLRDEGYEVTAISAPGRWTSDVEAEGIRFIPWRHATRAWDPAADIRAVGELVSILRRERFDLLHTHTPKPGVIGRIAARVAGVPFVVHTAHGLYVRPDDPIRRKAPVLGVEWFAARFSDLELYQSREDLTWARRLGIVSWAKSRFVGNGTNLTRFRPDGLSDDRRSVLRAELGIPEDAPVVGTLGRLVAEKGYRELLTAMREVRRVVPDARLLAIGPPDPAKPDALSQEELAAVGDWAVFTGPRSDTPELFALMDLFVLASWREGLSRAAIEAAAMGRPLVLTDIRGCREVVRDGVEGFLVPPRDARGLGDALVRLLGDPELRARMGSAARARAVERFDEERVTDIIVDSYRRLLSRNGARPGAPKPLTTVTEVK